MRSLHLVSSLARAYFEVYDNTDTPVTGLVDGAFAKLLARDGVTDATVVTVAEIGSGRYVATFTPTTTGAWHLVVRHATHNPSGWHESHDVTTNGPDMTLLLPRADIIARRNTATGGGAAAITLDAGASVFDDFYNGLLALIVSGTGVGQARSITDYVGATKVATVDPVWVTNPDATSVFSLIPSETAVAAALAGQVADAVWDELSSGHTTQGSFGSLAQRSTLRTNTAQAGGASTITLDASASVTNDLYNGAVVLIYSGTGAGQTRRVIDYDGATKIATVEPAWFTNPDATSVFVLLPNDPAVAVGAGGINAASLATDTIQASKIQDNALTAAKIATDAIGASQIAPNAITNTKIADGLLSPAKFSVGAITSAVLADDAITAAKIAPDAIGSSELATSAINEIRDAILSDSIPFQGARIDAAVSSRADGAQYTGTRAAKLDNLDNLNVLVSTRSAPGDAMALAADAVSASAVSTAGANKIADHAIRRSFTNARTSATGADSPSFRSLLGAIAKMINKSAMVGSTLNVYQDDDTTVFGQQAATTQAGADPIVSLDTV